MRNITGHIFVKDMLILIEIAIDPILESILNSVMKKIVLCSMNYYYTLKM